MEFLSFSEFAVLIPAYSIYSNYYAAMSGEYA